MSNNFFAQPIMATVARLLQNRCNCADSFASMHFAKLTCPNHLLGFFLEIICWGISYENKWNRVIPDN